MRRIALALMSTLSGVVLLFSYHTSTNQPADAATGTSAAPAGTTTSGITSGSTSGTYTGDSVQTRWGPVQVEITVEDGKVVAAQAVDSPDDNPRDVEINSYAVPIYNDEAVQAQSAQIDAVSGATVTWQGYTDSLQSALDQAGL